MSPIQARNETASFIFPSVLGVSKEEEAQFSRATFVGANSFPAVENMRRFSNSLDNVSVAAPCPADWDAMIGDDRVRFCSQCELNVYNLSAMSPREAESLIARTEGRLCVSFYRRRDGSIITENCPVGLRRLKQRAFKFKRAVGSAVLGFLAAVGVHGMLKELGILLPAVPRPEFYGRTAGMMVDRRAPQPIIEHPRPRPDRPMTLPLRSGSHPAPTKADLRS